MLFDNLRTQPASKEQTMTEPTDALPSTRSVAHTRHGHSSRQLNSGAKDSPTYRSWLAMRSRCNLDGRDNSDRYREKGVSYDARWESFEIFLRDMGERPHGLSQATGSPLCAGWPQRARTARAIVRNSLSVTKFSRPLFACRSSSSSASVGSVMVCSLLAGCVQCLAQCFPVTSNVIS